MKWKKPKNGGKHPLTNQQQNRGQDRQDEATVNVHGSIQAYPPQDLINKHDAERKEDAAQHTAERKEDRALESKKLLWEKLAFVVIVAYTSIAAWQACLTRQAVENTSRQFQIDQRPYLWTTNVRPTVSIQAGQRMWANIPVDDFGKSPALKVRVTGEIFIGPDAKKQADLWFDTIGDKEITDPDKSEIVVPPGIASTFPEPTKPPVQIVPGMPQDERMAFGGGGFFSIFGPPKALTQPDVDYILKTDDSAVMVMRLQYFDGFGNRYWSNICMSRFANGNIPYCVHHNEIH